MRSRIAPQPAMDTSTGVEIFPASVMRRRIATWKGIRVESLELTRLERFECRVKSPSHILIAAEKSERDDGESVVEGFQRSTQREFSHKLHFIPGGHYFHGWQDPRVLMRCTFVYIDPAGPLFDPELRFSEIEFKPRLFFFDRDIWETVLKLKPLVEHPASSGYAEALGLVLAHELIRSNRGDSAAILRGGLASWQKKKVTEYIEEHLTENISLRQLAAVAQLSHYHFARAFKQSFGIPPHHYHMALRMERAKAILEGPARTVTEVGVMLGFSETSSFTASFRRSVGVTPTNYRRSVT
jgi:AraC family transcriptional regulator